MFVTSYNLREGVVCGGIGMEAGGAGGVEIGGNGWIQLAYLSGVMAYTRLVQPLKDTPYSITL